MPYLKTEDRKRLSLLTGEIGKAPLFNPGDLNYAISLMVRRYLEINELKYQSLNDIVGALECAKAEVYRRIAVPYEDTKIEQNGEVFW